MSVALAPLYHYRGCTNLRSASAGVWNLEFALCLPQPSAQSGQKRLERGLRDASLMQAHANQHSGFSLYNLLESEDVLDSGTSWAGGMFLVALCVNPT